MLWTNIKSKVPTFSNLKVLRRNPHLFNDTKCVRITTDNQECLRSLVTTETHVALMSSSVPVHNNSYAALGQKKITFQSIYTGFFFYLLYCRCRCRCRWPRCLRRKSAAASLLRLQVRIPLKAWIFVRSKCCMLSGRGLCDKLITRPDESYRLCDLETSWWIRRPWPTEGPRAKTNKLALMWQFLVLKEFKFL
jgi:hypothetical protein